MNTLLCAFTLQTGNEDRSIRVSGRLVEVDGGSRVLVVRDHVIEINPNAEIVGDTYERIAFESLAEGRQVSIWGWLHDDGRIEGFRVELRLPNKEDFQIVGVLSDIQDRFVYVNGVKFFVPELAFIGAPEIGRLPFDNLFPGLIVNVEGANWRKRVDWLPPKSRSLALTSANLQSSSGRSPTCLAVNLKSARLACRSTTRPSCSTATTSGSQQLACKMDSV